MVKSRFRQFACLLALASLSALGAEDRCGLKPESGQCKGRFSHFFFDAAHGQCREFFYGGCGGVVPFETQADCERECLKDRPGREEYEIYNTVLGDANRLFDVAAPARAVGRATIAVEPLDAGKVSYLARLGLQVDAGLVEDFNRKRALQDELSAALVRPPMAVKDWKPSRLGGELEILRVSRVGFDKAGRRALLVVAYTYINQEAFYDAGTYVLLEAAPDGWRVVGTARAWLKFS
ncbi:MAG: BPTI/Kunitz domain-containing protein [Denitratisoma sp.]|nr:BPTI/Kunitz domain-containing protein [Denitratisoma sp.]